MPPRPPAETEAEKSSKSRAPRSKGNPWKGGERPDNDRDENGKSLRKLEIGRPKDTGRFGA